MPELKITHNGPEITDIRIVDGETVTGAIEVLNSDFTTDFFVWFDGLSMQEQEIFYMALQYIITMHRREAENVPKKRKRKS